MPDPRQSAEFRTSRELSDRVEREFHQRPDPFRWWIRWLSVAACMAVLAWLGVAAATGRRTIYEAGPVAPAHRFFENNCAVCHTTWAPATRFRVVAGDTRPVHSVDDASCQRCHAGSPHYDGQHPPHDGLACAACHREHRHDASLIASADAQCVACHGALDEHMPAGAETATAGLGLPASIITSFAEDHPNFDALAQRDSARLAFNHSVHLRSEYDKDGKLVKGIQNERGELEDLSRNCAACHQVDSDRRYMQPVRYAQHCQRCHPLYFDNANFAGETAPHGVSTATLRGFLIERYTALALEDAGLMAPQPPPRPLPGRAPADGALTEEGRRQVRESAAAADERLVAPIAETEEAARAAALRREVTLFGPDALGGCRLCHEVDAPNAEPDRRGFAPEWEIAPPGVPERWMERARFSHDAHRFVACTACHRDASYSPPRAPADSTATSDVLMPSIAACRSCHGDRTGTLIVGDATLSGPPVASRCIDCHDYHRREDEPLSGSVFFDLPETPPAGNDGS